MIWWAALILVIAYGLWLYWNARLALIFAAGVLAMLLAAPLSQFLPAFWRPWWLPNVALLTTLYLAFGVRGSPSAGAFTAVSVGYVADLLAGAPKGTYILALLVIYFMARGSTGRLYVQGRLFQIGVTLFGALLCSLFVVTVHVALPPRGDWSTLARAPAEAAITAVLAPLFYYLMWRLDRRVARHVVSEGVFR